MDESLRVLLNSPALLYFLLLTSVALAVVAMKVIRKKEGPKAR